MRNLKHRTQHLPIAFTGLALGIGGLGNCLSLLFSNHGYDARWISYITISIVIIFILLISIRSIIHPKILKYELNDSMVVTLLPTFSMSLMLIAGFIAGFDSNINSWCQITGTIIMCLAILIQIILIAFFFRSVIKNHIKVSNSVYGSYFVPTVGIITACTVATKFTLIPITFFQVIWFIGYLFYLVSFPLITYAILFRTKLEKNKLPTLAVWFAPTNLVPAGFINAFLLSKSDIAYGQTFFDVLFLLTIICGFVFSLILYLLLFRIFWTCQFQPIFCAITFPCAIGATSMLNAAKYLFLQLTENNQAIIPGDLSHNFIVHAMWFFGIVGIIFCFITTIIIIYILIRMLIFAYNTLFTNINDDKVHEVYKTK